MQTFWSHQNYCYFHFSSWAVCEYVWTELPRLAFRTKWLVEKYLNEHYQMETHSAFIYFSSKGTDSNRVFTSCRWWVRHSIIYVLALLFASLHRLQQTFEHSSTRTFTLACTVANKLMLYIKKNCIRFEIQRRHNTEWNFYFYMDFSVGEMSSMFFARRQLQSRSR